jgi:hypothetical protein
MLSLESLRQRLIGFHVIVQVLVWELVSFFSWVCHSHRSLGSCYITIGIVVVVNHTSTPNIDNLHHGGWKLPIWVYWLV